jgi:hypothetical protein
MPEPRFGKGEEGKKIVEEGGGMKAFPNHRSEGMDLRDYIAIKAMQSLFDSKILTEVCKMETKVPLTELVASMSYQMANAMMEAREK